VVQPWHSQAPDGDPNDPIKKVQQKKIGKKMKNSNEYIGPFPRKKHSHKCPGLGCKIRGQERPVACYKTQCTKPSKTLCASCRQDMERP